MWAAFMQELRVMHLGEPRKPGARDVLAELTQAYLNVKARLDAAR